MPTTTRCCERWGRWYIADRDPRWVRRNALVVLGNVGPARRQPMCAGASPTYLAHDDPMLRAHAVWAARRLGLDALLPIDDTDPVVAEELAAAAVKHLLVTNDFPPKIGGIQSLLWEWWRRLPPDSFAVLTSPYAGAAAFDAEQPFHVERTREPVLLPHPWMVSRINEMAARVGADLVVLDPAVPLGPGRAVAAPALRRRACTVPRSPCRVGCPVTKQALAYVLRGARHIVAAGSYPAREAERAAGRTLPITVVPPGVDTERFRPLDRRRACAPRGRASGCRPTPS